MTDDQGSVEPVDADQSAAQHDDLEHWLHGIRTDLTGNTPEWPATADAAEAPGDAGVRPAVDRDDPEPGPRGAQTIGRHRAED